MSGLIYSSKPVFVPMPVADNGLPRQTSLDSYLYLNDSICLAKCQRQVLLYVRENLGCTDKEIARALNLAINQVTGRRRELELMGLIKQAGRKLDPQTKRHNISWMRAK